MRISTVIYLIKQKIWVISNSSVMVAFLENIFWISSFKIWFLCYKCVLWLKQFESHCTRPSILSCHIMPLRSDWGHTLVCWVTKPGSQYKADSDPGFDLITLCVYFHSAWGFITHSISFFFIFFFFIFFLFFFLFFSSLPPTAPPCILYGFTGRLSFR